jgi:glycine hydroxymethyltransferase
LCKLGAEQWQYERSVINLIASDNALPVSQSAKPPYCGHMIQEGLRGRRPFAGAAIHDEMEALAEAAACRVFDAEHANLQPHSCSQANQAVYHALLSRGDNVLALGFRDGGHLTHGLSSNFSGKSYRFTSFGTDINGYIDYSQVNDAARSTRPRLIVCGSSSYPRFYDAAALRAIADDVNAQLMFDLSHEGGLIAGGVFPNLIPVADVSTMSLDKTLRGPFGGLILCRAGLAAGIDRGVHPGTQSSFPIRKLTDAAHALILTHTPAFRDYARRVLENAKALEKSFSSSGATMLTGGTDKHYLVLNVYRSFSLTGEEAERRLEDVGILASRQTLSTDISARSKDASGLRLGTPWITSRGYSTSDVEQTAAIVLAVLSTEPDRANLKALKGHVTEITAQQRPLDAWGTP